MQILYTPFWIEIPIPECNTFKWARGEPSYLFTHEAQGFCTASDGRSLPTRRLAIWMTSERQTNNELEFSCHLDNV